MRSDRALPPRLVAKSYMRTVSTTGSRGHKGDGLLERQETLLAVTGQVGDPLYSNTREAVL
jgi:hypothetical protein